MNVDYVLYVEGKKSNKGNTAKTQLRDNNVLKYMKV